MKKERQLKNRKRLRLIPLILGGYGAFLGFGLAAIGFTEMKEGIGIVRLLIGFGMAGFGMLGIWDGVRNIREKCRPASLSLRIHREIGVPWLHPNFYGNRWTSLLKTGITEVLISRYCRRFLRENRGGC